MLVNSRDQKRDNKRLGYEKNNNLFNECVSLIPDNSSFIYEHQENSNLRLTFIIHNTDSDVQHVLFTTYT